MSNREEIIKQLGEIRKHNDGSFSHNLSYTMKRWELELVADWIIKDRERVCEPLVRQLINIKDALNIFIVKNAMEREIINRIDETLNIFRNRHR